MITIVGVLAGVFVYNRVHSADARGLVKGILYTIEDSSVLINNQMLREGEIIHGVTIVKVDRKKVVFEKNGCKWEQRINEAPNPAWQSDDTD